MPHDELTGVVAGGADRGLGLHAAVLAGEVAVIDSSATRIAEHIHAVDAIGGIERVGGEVVVDILRGAVPRGSAAVGSKAGRIWEQILPIRNLGDGSRGNALIVLILEQIDGGEVVH